MIPIITNGLSVVVILLPVVARINTRWLFCNKSDFQWQICGFSTVADIFWVLRSIKEKNWRVVPDFCTPLYLFCAIIIQTPHIHARYIMVSLPCFMCVRDECRRTRCKHPFRCTRRPTLCVRATHICISSLLRWRKCAINSSREITKWRRASRNGG